MDQAPTDGDDPRMEELKEVKFVIPVKHHVNLHSWKLLQNETISETVSRALNEYFERHGSELPPAGSTL